MAKSRDVTDALARLAAAEERFLASEFLAPVARGGRVQVRIAGVINLLRIRPAEFEGWGIFRPASHAEAALVRPASLAERSRYLELFPLVRLILAGKCDGHWLALPAHQADTRFRIDGRIPVRLVDEGRLFEVVEARFDGTQFWYAGPDSRWDPATAQYLREELERLTPPERLRRSGLTAAERAAYSMNYWPRFGQSEEGRRTREERRLRGALSHAGAELVEYIERPDVYSVTYMVDGQRHVSAVSKNDLSIQVAGICLNGEDRAFDLQSLVGVIREAAGGGELVRVGDENHGMPEDHYWDAHPPQ
ncbi:MAG TPA: hypothetical protein VH120_00515 [Gemmataceae bacterium]|jgi:hypothetical protein|nr:hypothetical protein [Gemmataceae bacterium]